MKVWKVLEQAVAQDSTTCSPCFAFYDCTDKDDDGTPPSPTTLSYRDVYEAARKHRRWLIRRCIGSGANRSDTVIAYLSSNSPDYLISLLAATTLNSNGDNYSAHVVLLNTRWTPAEISTALQSSCENSRTLILFGRGHEEQARRAVELMESRSMAWCLPIPSFSLELLRRQMMVSDDTSKAHLVGARLDTDDEDDALVVFTSGTSGGAKGVRLSHRALCIQARAKCQAPCQYNRSTRMQATTVPFFHVGGLSSVLAVLLAGGTLVFPICSGTQDVPANGFETESVLRSLVPSRGGVNTLVVVPAMLYTMLNHEHLENAIHPEVHLILIGGQSTTTSMLERLKHIFPSARLVQTYACTEAASSITFLDLRRRTDTLTVSVPDGGPSGDCVGLPPPHVELALLRKSSDGRHPSAIGRRVQRPFEVGVFATRGAHVMSGYWNRDEPTPRQFHRNRWFVTNDLGFTDEKGHFYFCGRTKDLIRTGGETVVATEVERVLLQCTEIEECAVFALPDERFGETVCAAIVAARGTSPVSLPTIRQFCARRDLAGYKRPRRVFRLSELPRNSSGKILKYRLVERFTAPAIRSKL